VLKVDQQEVKTNDQLIHYIREKKPEDTIVLQVYRKGDFMDLKVTLGERPRKR
jgi:S1-C subfamily serine protease